MSWLARSIADSLLIDDEDDRSSNDDNDNTNTNDNRSQSVKQQFNTRDHTDQEDTSDNQARTGGVKEDLSEFTESLTRQLRGVASFLAPPPPPPPPPPPTPPRRQRSSTTATQSDPSVSDRYRRDSSVSGNGDDDVTNSVYEGSRIGGGSGVSNSSTFPSGDQNENEKAVVGITEEVLAFAMNIAHHPETWLDFPLSEEEEDSDDFEMSDAQWNHATLIEHLTPRLAALRIELCPIHMSESYFWKVYFVLLHSRLNKHDTDLLSTPQIVEARAMWMKELQKQTKPEPDLFERNTSHKFDGGYSLHEDFTAMSSDLPSANMSERSTNAFEPTAHSTMTDKYPVLRDDNETIDKSVPEEGGLTKTSLGQRAVPSYKIPIEDFDDDDDDWIHENSELDGYEGPDVIGTDDISFSDLEDDDCMIPTRSKVI